MVRKWLAKKGLGKGAADNRGALTPASLSGTEEPEQVDPGFDIQIGDEVYPETEPASGDGTAVPGISARLTGKYRRKRKARAADLEAEYIDSGVVGIGRNSFAVGFAWSNRNPDLSLREQVEEITSRAHVNAKGEALRYDLILDANRMGSLGLSEAQSSGQAPGMLALISCMPEATLGVRWLGVFRVNGVLDAWWIGSVRDGKVFEDQVILGRHAAEEIFHQNLEAPGWITVIAPPEWAIPDSVDLRLGEVIDSSGGLKIKHMTPLRANLPRFILLGGLGVAAIVLAWAWSDMKTREAEEMERLRREAENAVILRPQDHPWFESTPITDFVAACQAAISRAIFLVPGWEAQPISCTVDHGRGVVATGWTRAGGRISWLNAALPPEFPRAVLEEEGERASLSFGFEMQVDANSVASEPWEGNVIESNLRARFQSFGIEISIEESRESRKDRNKERDRSSPSRKDVARPVFKSHDLRVTATAGVDEIALLLKDVPALVPQALIYNVATSSWDLMAKAYHPPIIPGEQK